MRLATISDIHGNLPALEAVLADIERRGVDDILCLGDLVNFAGWDNEVIDRLRKRGITCIQGNHDEGIGWDRACFDFSYADARQLSFGLLSIAHTGRTLSAGHRRFLRYLPTSVRLEFKLALERLSILFVHASPASAGEYVRPDVTDARLAELLDLADADVLCMGHTHQPMHRMVLAEADGRKIYRHAINPGSVGKAGMHADYLVLEIDENFALHLPELLRIDHHQVPYDSQAVADHIRSLGLPGTYDAFLGVGTSTH